VNWVLTLPFCAVLIEIIVRMSLARPLKQVMRFSNRAVRVVKADAVSDHWKEKAMRAYAQATFSSTMQVAGLFALWIVAAAALVLGFDLLSGSFQEFFLSWIGIGFSCLVGCLYAFARRGFLRE